MNGATTIFMVMLFPLYMLACMVDLMVSLYYEKKLFFYPTIEFTCFCGFKRNMMAPVMIPFNTYRFWCIHQHTKSCLVWIMNSDFNGLLPVWGHSYAKDLREIAQRAPGMWVTKEWCLEQAKLRSKRNRAGRDAFNEKGDPPGFTDDI